MEKSLILFSLLLIFLLVGCTLASKSAQELGQGISVEIATSQEILSVQQVIWLNGVNQPGETTTLASNNPFSIKDQIIFEMPSINANDQVKFSINYTQDKTTKELHTTNKIDISAATKWVTLLLNEKLELEIIGQE